MRISDWSSDVCSSDLVAELLDAARYEEEVPLVGAHPRGAQAHPLGPVVLVGVHGERVLQQEAQHEHRDGRRDRKSVVSGKSVSVRVDLGGRRVIKKKKNTEKSSSI